MRLKNLAKYIYHYSGIEKGGFWFLRNFDEPLLLIISYHKVCSSMDSYGYMTMPADAFEGHIKFIKDNFNVVAMIDGLNLIKEEGRRGVYVSINLDDGYMDNFTHAFPVLKKYSVPATLFLTTDFIGKDHLFWWDEVFQLIQGSGCKSHGVSQGRSIQDAFKAGYVNDFLMNKKEPNIRDFVDKLRKKSRLSKGITRNRMLGWPEIKEMVSSGMNFGSHTMTHKNLLLMEDKEIRKELMDSRLELEKNLGPKKFGFCYPFSIYDDRVRDIVKDAGFDYARTSISGSNTKNTDKFSLRCIDASFLFNKVLFTSSVSFYSLRH